MKKAYPLNGGSVEDVRGMVRYSTLTDLRRALAVETRKTAIKIIRAEIAKREDADES